MSVKLLNDNTENLPKLMSLIQHKIAFWAHVLMLMQVCMAADEGLGAILPQQPPAVCLSLLKTHLPAQGTVNSPACQPTPLIHVSYHQHNCLCTVLAELVSRLASCIHSKAAGIHGGGRPSFLTSRASQSLACWLMPIVGVRECMCVCGTDLCLWQNTFCILSHSTCSEACRLAVNKACACLSICLGHITRPGRHHSTDKASARPTKLWN